MKALILALFLFPVQSWASTPCPKKLEERTSPCTASPEEQAEITGYIEAGLSAHVAFENDLAKEARLREEAMAMQDKWETEEGKKAVGAWKDAEERRQDSEHAMRSNFKLATEKTSAYYGISAQHNNIANGPMNGEAAKWNPEFLYFPKDDGGQYKKLYFELERSDGVKHYTSTGETNPANADSMTDADGKSSLLISAFIDAQSNPGRLAWALQHEAVHVGHLTSDGWASSEAEEERTLEADEVDAATADTFELPYNFRIALDGKRAEYTEKLRLAKAHPNEIKHLLHSPFPRPSLEEDYKREFGIAQADLDKIKEGRAALLAQVEKSRQEHERAEREQRASEEENVRQSKQIAERYARQELLNELTSCWYEPIYRNRHDDTIIAFKDEDHRHDYLPGENADLQGLKILMLITRACDDVYRGVRPNDFKACNDAAPALRKPMPHDLRQQIELTNSSHAECVEHILTNASRITDSTSFIKVAADYEKILKKKRAEEAKRDRKRKESERDEKPGGGSPPPDGNDHFWDPGCNCWVRRY